MKTFSNMSIPDLILTKESYCYYLQRISDQFDDHLSEQDHWQLRAKQARTRILIAAIDEEIKILH